MNLIEEFKNQHIIFKILDILFIISLICEITLFRSLNISLWILGLIIVIKFCEWFFKKEE